MKIFVTSNQQFGRKGAIRKYKRPFESLEEMNDALVIAWNSVVSNEDIVYVLGNFAWDPETVENIGRDLNGTIIVVPGEFDDASREVSSISNRIKFAPSGIEELTHLNSVVSYWPLKEWKGKRSGSYSVIGYPDKRYKSDHKSKIVNCSCDFWEYKPVEINKLIELFNDVSN